MFRVVWGQQVQSEEFQNLEMSPWRHAPLWTPFTSLIFRKDVGVADALPGLCHHLHHGVAPKLVVRCLFMSGGRLDGSIDFHEHEFGGILGLLKDVKAYIPCLLNALGCILKGRLFERFDKFRFDMYMNMDDVHFFSSYSHHQNS